MTGETNLQRLLAQLRPRLLPGLYVFCTLKRARYGDYAELNPLASFQEDEGLSLVVEKQAADHAGFDYGLVCKCITLSVHSSLEAVGLTAAIANRLAGAGISANIIAGNFHDHVFVPADRAEQALMLVSAWSE